MKKRSLIVLSLSILIVAATAAAALADERSDALARGAKIFADPGLGANGKSCSACHGDGAVWAGKPRFPKVALGGLRTLDQAIQTCISNAQGGKPIPWDDPRLTALAVFVDAAYAPKK
jgi:mono/diheme cytochrome c family protein